MKKTIKKVYSYECTGYTPQGIVKMKWKSEISPDTKNYQTKLEQEAESITKFPVRGFNFLESFEDVKVDVSTAILLN